MAQRKIVPISVAVDKDAREVFAAEARRRGLGVSTTIRVLAMERAKEIRQERQVAKAWKWQLRKAHEAIAAIDRGENPVVPHSEIDRLFDETEARMRKRLNR